jgi:hypothetical protein
MIKLSNIKLKTPCHGKITITIKDGRVVYTEINQGFKDEEEIRRR